MSDYKCFCVLPWLHRFTNEQGESKLCCHGEGEQSCLHDAEGRPLHVSQQLTDEQVLNSPDMKRIRRQMLRGEWPAACDRCRLAEESEGSSFRNGYNDTFRQHAQDCLDRTAPDGTVARPAVRYADIRLGNVCNLTCRMCGPAASRAWIKHVNAVQSENEQMSPEVLDKYWKSNWVKRQSFLGLLDQCLSSVEIIHFAGGEPLMIPEMVEALEHCIASGRASQIQLRYTTNMTVLPEKVTRLWPEFERVHLTVSLDGYGKVNDYIRRPPKWREIDQNLRLLDNNYDKWNLSQVAINTTVQAYNVFEIGDLHAYLAENFARITSVPFLSPLFQPEFLSAQILPEHIRAAARQHVSDVGARAQSLCRPEHQWALGSFKTVLDHLDCEPRSPEALNAFLAYTERTDREFGESWRSACPGLASHIRG